MRILISNDDGVNAPGIAALHDVLAAGSRLTHWRTTMPIDDLRRTALLAAATASQHKNQRGRGRQAQAAKWPRLMHRYTECQERSPSIHYFSVCLPGREARSQSNGPCSNGTKRTASSTCRLKPSSSRTISSNSCSSPAPTGITRRPPMAN